MSTAPPSTLAATPGGSPRDSVPFGPFSSIAASFTVALTPFGRAIGRLPIRDCRKPSWSGTWVVMGSPDLAKKLAADALLASFAIRHDAAARAEDRDAHAGAHALDSIVPHVDAPPRRGD